MPRRKSSINPPLNIYKKIAISFIILTLILIAVIFYFTLSYAYITVYPKAQEIQTDFNFVIVEDPELVDAKEGIFLGQIVNETLTGEKTFETTGTKQVFEDVVGQVRIYNDLSRDQVLVATTRLLTPEDVLFRLQNRVNVPAGGSIVTEVYPDDPNQPLATADTEFAIPGLSQTLQEFVYAEAENDFVAEGVTVKAISQEEIDQAIEDFTGELSRQIFKEENVDKTKILTKEIVEQELSNQVGEEIDEYTINLTLRVVGVMFDEQPVQNFAQKTLESLVPLDKDLVVTNKDSLIYEIEKYDLENQLVQVSSTIKGVTIISEDSEILASDKLIKLKPAEIRAYLENFEGIESVDIGFFPSWIKKVPYFQDHIIIKIAQ
ncbi:MAG: hypothetical protein GF365_03095 [Candidatus Buchananbacteria bacterium]|nr:hypothetical protein [Candidatus Buchananbacteria bacterium]